MKKGVLFTIITVMMFMSLYSMTAYFYRRAGMQDEAVEIRHMRSRGLYDDLLRDIDYIVNMTSDVNRTPGRIHVTFWDFVPPPWNITDSLWNYGVFLDDFYEKRININVSMNVTARVPWYSLNPLDFVYAYDSYWKNQIYVINTSPDIQYIDAYQVNIYAWDDDLNDLIWLEAELFEGGGGNTTLDALAFDGNYSFDWNNYTRTLYHNSSLENTNYTLWVRSRDDNVMSHAFKIAVNGVNSTATFGDFSSSPMLEWQWEKGDNFTFPVGESQIDLLPLGDSTGACDVVVFKTNQRDVPPDFSPPSVLIDPLVEQPGLMPYTTSTSLGVNLTVYAANLNYSWDFRVNESSPSNWTFVFEDNDTFNITAGSIVVSPHVADYGLLIEYYNVSSDSRAGIDTHMEFRTTLVGDQNSTTGT